MKNVYKIWLFVGLTVISVVSFIGGGVLFCVRQNIQASLWSTILISLAASLLAGVLTACLLDIAIFAKEMRDASNNRKIFFEVNTIRILNLAIQSLKYSNNTFIPSLGPISQEDKLIDLLKKKIELIDSKKCLYNEQEDISIKPDLESKIAYLNDSFKMNIDLLLRSPVLHLMFVDEEIDCLKNAYWMCEQINNAQTCTSIIIGINELLTVTLMHIKESKKIMEMTIQQIDNENKYVDIP